MKLFELTGVKKYAETELTDILNDFIKKQQIKVRTGGFSIVILPEGKDYVFKVWTSDPGFDAYLKFVKSHPGSKHLPKFIGDVRKVPMFFKRPEQVGDEMNVIRMEKLTPIKANSDLEAAIGYIIGKLRVLKISALEPSDAKELLTKKLVATKPYHDLGAQAAIKPEELNKQLEKLVDLTALMIEVWKNIGANNPEFGEDLIGNIMLRGDTPVIADPYYTKHMYKMTASDLITNRRNVKITGYKTGRTK